MALRRLLDWAVMLLKKMTNLRYQWQRLFTVVLQLALYPLALG